MLKVPDLDALSLKEVRSLSQALAQLKRYCDVRAELLEAEMDSGTEAAESARACQEQLNDLYQTLPDWAHWKAPVAPQAPPGGPPTPSPPPVAQAAPPPPPAPAAPGPAPKGWEPFTPEAAHSIEAAKAIACRLGSEDIDTAHLLLGMLKQGLSLPGVPVDTLRNELEVFAGRGGEPVDEAFFTEDTKRVISCAFEEQRAAGQMRVDVPHLLCGILRVSDCVAARTLVHHGLTLEAARKALKS